MSKILAILFLGTLGSVNALASLNFSPSSVDMGQIRVGSSTTRYASLRNAGQQEVSVSISNSCFSDFWVTNGCYGRLGPGNTCNINIRFSPRRPGSSSCSISARDSQGGTASLYIRGYGYEDQNRR